MRLAKELSPTHARQNKKQKKKKQIVKKQGKPGERQTMKMNGDETGKILTRREEAQIEPGLSVETRLPLCQY